MLPGRIPGYKRTDLQLLPCHTTKRSVWEKYTSAAAQLPGVRSVAYSTFCLIWRRLLPNILPTRPMTDLCAECHKNAGLIQRGSNLSEQEKSEVRLLLVSDLVPGCTSSKNIHCRHSGNMKTICTRQLWSAHSTKKHVNAHACFTGRLRVTANLLGRVIAVVCHQKHTTALTLLSRYIYHLTPFNQGRCISSHQGRWQSLE